MGVIKEVTYIIGGGAKGMELTVRTDVPMSRLTISHNSEGGESRVTIHKSQIVDLISSLEEILKSMSPTALGAYER